MGTAEGETAGTVEEETARELRAEEEDGGLVVGWDEVEAAPAAPMRVLARAASKGRG